MSTPRLVSVESGRPIASEVLGVTLGEAGAIFQLALAMAGDRVNPLSLMDGLAATWRAIGAEIALEPIE